MKKTKLQLITLAVAMTLLAGCSKQNDVHLTESQSPNTEIEKSSGEKEPESASLEAITSEIAVLETIISQISELETSALETPVPETPTPETPVPETPAPETPAPETPAPETPVPETPAPETPVPETPAPETPASETPAPETPASETPIPKTPDPETPVPETPASETPAPEPSVPEASSASVESISRNEDGSLNFAQVKKALGHFYYINYNEDSRYTPISAEENLVYSGGEQGDIYQFLVSRSFTKYPNTEYEYHTIETVAIFDINKYSGEFQVADQIYSIFDYYEP